MPHGSPGSWGGQPVSHLPPPCEAYRHRLGCGGWFWRVVSMDFSYPYHFPAGESPWYNWISHEKYTGSPQAQNLVDSVYDVCINILYIYIFTYCWWFRNPVNSPVEVKVVYLPLFFRVLYTSQVVSRISAINSINGFFRFQRKGWDR